MRNIRARYSSPQSIDRCRFVRRSHWNYWLHTADWWLLSIETQPWNTLELSQKHAQCSCSVELFGHFIFSWIIMNLQFTACNEHANEIKTDKFSVPKTIINKIIGTLDAYGRHTAHFVVVCVALTTLVGQGISPNGGTLQYVVKRAKI